MPIPSRVPGILANPSHGLFLAFQFNPSSLRINKGNTFTTIFVPGWTEPVLIWSHGQIKTVSWKLQFHGDAGNPVFPQIGIRDYAAVLESFLYPSQPIRIKSSTLSTVKSFLTGSATRFTPPPKATFIYGPNYWHGYLEIGAGWTESVFRSDLTPYSLEADVTLNIIESGVFAWKESEARKALATVVYYTNRLVDTAVNIQQALNTVTETISNLVI